MAEPKPPEVIAELLRQSPPLPEEARVVSVFLNKARTAMIDDVHDHFEKSVGPDGKPWKPLKFPRPRGGNKPLFDTGKLRDSITGKSPEFRSEVGFNYVAIGTVHPGANLMHAGGTVVPTKAKALAIPLTKDAVRAGSPRKFPRPLVMLWRNGAQSGALAEIKKPAKKAGTQEQNLRKKIGTYVPKQRAILAKIKSLTARAKKAKTGASKATLKGRIQLEYLKLRKLSKSTADNVRKKETLAGKRKAVLTLQYALVKKVVIPARPFVGFGPRLNGKLDSLAVKTVQELFRGTPNGR